MLCLSVKGIRAFTKISQSWENYHQGNTDLGEIDTYRYGFHSEEQNILGNWQLSLKVIVYFNKTRHMQCINKCQMGNKQEHLSLLPNLPVMIYFYVEKWQFTASLVSSFSFHMEMITFLLFFLSTVAMI